MRALISPQEIAFRQLVSSYGLDFSSDNDRFKAFVHAADIQRTLLCPWKIESHHALYEVGEEGLPNYVVQECKRAGLKIEEQLREKLLAAE